MKTTFAWRPRHLLWLFRNPRRFPGVPMEPNTPEKPQASPQLALTLLAMNIVAATTKGHAAR